MADSRLLVDRETIGKFANLTGDHSAIHLDREYALSLGYRDNFAHGLLGASWAAGVLAQAGSGAGGVPVAMEVNFGLPVFCGDQLSLQVGEEGAFATCNQEGQVTCHGTLALGPEESLDGRSAPPQEEAGDFQSDPDRVYFAGDVFACGPRGECAPHQFTEEEVTGFCEFSRQAVTGAPGVLEVPPMLVFCRAFAAWLHEFTRIRLPDDGFPGHLKDRWRQYLPVHVGDTLITRHRPSAIRSSNSRPGMALLEIALQTSNQQQQVVQDGTVLLMMAEGES